MSAQRLQAVLLLVALSFTLPVKAAFAQRAAALEESGIWIADATGNLRKVQPSSESFLRHEESP